MFKIGVFKIVVLLFLINQEGINAAFSSLEQDAIEEQAALKFSHSVQKPLLAVFPAAGRGTRLGETGLIKPKGFIEIDGEPIIQSSVRHLVEAGVERVLFITGHCMNIMIL